MSKKILVLVDFSEEHLSMIKSAAPGAEFVVADRKSLTPALLESAEIVLGNPPGELLKSCSKLEMLCLNSAGSDTYAREGVLPKGVVLTNATGAYGQVISEWLMGMILNVYNRFPEYRALQKEASWQKVSGEKRCVYGSTVLILGTGNIGTEFARRMQAMGAKTIGVRRTNAAKKEFFDEMHLNSELDTLLPIADILVLCLPSTPDTHHIIDEKRLSLMKKSAILLNVGRGDAVDPAALLKALRSEELLAACLDVTSPEPLPASDPLWQEPRLYLTPHISGGMDFTHTRYLIADIFAKNLKAHLGDKAYTNPVDRSTGYKVSE